MIFDTVVGPIVVLFVDVLALGPVNRQLKQFANAFPTDIKLSVVYLLSFCYPFD
jgi:hypothetical protein